MKSTDTHAKIYGHAKIYVQTHDEICGQTCAKINEHSLNYIETLKYTDRHPMKYADRPTLKYTDTPTEIYGQIRAKYTKPLKYTDTLKNIRTNSPKYMKVKVKVKQSHYRPGQAQRVPGS